MSKLLIVDDEESIRRVLRMNLESRGFEVHEAPTAGEGIEKAIRLSPQLVILDLGLPDKSGLEALKEIRRWSQVPIVILTVTDDELTKCALLEAGADDYVTKPFSMMELGARIKVALRHSPLQAEAPLVFESGHLFADIGKKLVLRNGESVHLTATELGVLRALIAAKGQVVPQEQILSDVWGPNAVENPHYLRIYIGQLRKKLETDPSAPQHILTEPGIGYRLV